MAANGGADTWASGIRKLAAGLPAIVVMPGGGMFGMYTDWWHDGARANPAWASYHLRLLKDTIESRYRVLPERRWHAIGGISMGGQGALRYAGLLPGYFGSVVGFSAASPNTQAPRREPRAHADVPQLGQRHQLPQDPVLPSFPATP
jgi:S-formylglutathione hydrolase FrmB